MNLVNKTRTVKFRRNFLRELKPAIIFTRCVCPAWASFIYGKVNN